MLNTETMQKLEQIITEVAQREGCEFYELEFSGSGRGRTLRIYIDKSGGVSIDDCANVSRALNLRLDVEDIIPGGAYQLEVSSPGLERPLKKSHHFAAALGQKAKMSLTETLGNLGLKAVELAGAKRMTAEILAINEDRVRVKINEEELEIPLSAISKAHIVFDFGKETKQQKKKR